jgi:hypothetical protein
MRFTTAAEMVKELVEARRNNELRRVTARWTLYELLVIEEMGYVALAEAGAEMLFQVISGRAEKAAVIITTNLPFSEWTTVFPNAWLCKAMVDPLTDRAHIVDTGTESYRFRRSLDKQRKKNQGRRARLMYELVEPEQSWFYAKVRWAVMMEGREISEWEEAGCLFRSEDFDSAFQRALMIGMIGEGYQGGGEEGTRRPRGVETRLAEVVTLDCLGTELEEETEMYWTRRPAREKIPFEHRFEPAAKEPKSQY